MISQKFSIISADKIARFVSESETQRIDDSLLDSIECVSDLWILANMTETLHEQNKIHNGVADFNPDVCPAD